MMKQLLEAIKADNVDAAARILAASPALLRADVIGETWLSHAARANSLGCMAILVDRGIPVEVDWFDCPAPICSAAGDGALEAVKWLLEKGASIEGTSTRVPPITDAILSNSTEMVKLFLDNGARTDYTFGEFNYTPLTFARSLGPEYSDVASLLEAHCKGEPAPATAPADPVLQHLESLYGEAEPLSQQAIITDLPVVIHVIRHQGKEPCTILATSGMSARAMTVPVGGEDYQYAELMMFLPPDWPSGDAINSEQYQWPYEWLRRIAHYPHEHNTWLGTSCTFSNEEPPEPFAPGTELSCLLALADFSKSGQLVPPDGKKIQLYSLYPVYREEKDLVERRGVEALIEKFQLNKVSAVLNLSRKNTAK